MISRRPLARLLKITAKKKHPTLLTFAFEAVPEADPPSPQTPVVETSPATAPALQLQEEPESRFSIGDSPPPERRETPLQPDVDVGADSPPPPATPTGTASSGAAAPASVASTSGDALGSVACTPGGEAAPGEGGSWGGWWSDSLSLRWRRPRRHFGA